MRHLSPVFRNAPLWGLTLLALALALALSGWRHRSWIVPASLCEARPSGQFERRAPDAAPLPPVFIDADATYWLRYAAEILDGKSLRVRRMDGDNVPAGREVHWSSLLPWSMALAARASSLFTGRPAAENLVAASLRLNPLFFCLFLLGTAWILSRRLGPWTSGLLVLALLGLPPVIKDFSAARIDHHGLVDVPALWMTLLLLIGLCGSARADETSPRRPSDSRRWFIAAGIVGGLGFWLQASLQLILVAGTLGALFLQSIVPDPADDDSPRLWRAWAAAGALTSLAAYALEYVPAHLGLRFEVNHPLYALSWWGATEAILQFRRMRRARVWSWTGAGRMAAGLLPASATVALVVFGGERFFRLSAPLMQRIHAQIGEFAPLLGFFKGNAGLSLLYLLGLLPFVALGALPLLRSRSVPAAAKRGLGIALVPALLAAVLGLRHMRYASLLGLALVSAAAAALLALDAARARRGKAAVLAALAVGCGIGLAMEFRTLRGARERPLSQSALRGQLIWRDVARELAGLPGFAESRVVCGFDEAPALQYFAGVATTGGFYWENAAGLRAATDFFSTADDEAARRLLRERGISWVVLDGRPQNVASWYYNRHGAITDAGVRASLAFRLATRTGVPPWLEPIPPGRIPLATQAAFLVYRAQPLLAPPSPPAEPAP